MIDVSCFVGTGPLVAPELSTPESVAALLSREGVSKAAVSPMAALFHPTPSATLPNSAFYHPVPIVTPDWHPTADVTAIRITPGTHGYTAVEAAELRKTCAAQGIVLILQMRVADPRNLPADLPLGEVPTAEAIALARVATAPMIIAGARAAELSTILHATPDSVLADISLAEAPDLLRRTVTTHGAHRLLIGTHTPFLTPAAARLKLAAAHLPPADHEAVSHGNANRLGF